MNIDAVITWVDGNDPILNAKRQKYGTSKDFARNDVAGATRYANIGEIYWCVASINRFAPWIRKIYIVTDGQNPHLEPFLEKHFPNGYIPIEIVDHTVIFKGYEQFLPTFNACAIETMLWRIPGLSEHYIYFNDDTIITSPVSKQDFFVGDNGVMCIADWVCTAWARLLLSLKPKRDGKKVWSYKGMMLNASKILGDKFLFPRINHTPKGLLKSYYEEFFAKHPDLLIHNIQYKFRNAEEYHVVALQYMDLYRQSRCKVEAVSEYLFYYRPKKKANYLAKKIKKLFAKNYKFCCFNSLDEASAEDQKFIANWLEKRLGLS